MGGTVGQRFAVIQPLCACSPCIFMGFLSFVIALDSGWFLCAIDKLAALYLLSNVLIRYYVTACFQQMLLQKWINQTVPTLPSWDLISSCPPPHHHPPFPTGSHPVWLLSVLLVHLLHNESLFLNDSLNTLIKSCLHLCAGSRVHRGAHTGPVDGFMNRFAGQRLRLLFTGFLSDELSSLSTTRPPTHTNTHTHIAINLSGSHTCIQKDLVSQREEAGAVGQWLMQF